jgi:hypothetical protein
MRFTRLGEGRTRNSKKRRHIVPGMLRLRKKPPAGLPMINTGKPWSAMDMADLLDFHETGSSVETIALYLCRTVEEVQAKIDEVERQIAAPIQL